LEKETKRVGGPEIRKPKVKTPEQGQKKEIALDKKEKKRGRQKKIYRTNEGKHCGGAARGLKRFLSGVRKDRELSCRHPKSKIRMRMR